MGTGGIKYLQVSCTRSTERDKLHKIPIWAKEFLCVAVLLPTCKCVKMSGIIWAYIIDVLI